MSRTNDEWVGRTDDTPVPPRVKERITKKAGDCCQKCFRKIGGKLRAEFDHEIPLIIGGANAESNLALLCHECHAAKTKLDVKIKAKVARVRKKHLGLTPKRKQIQSAGFAKAGPKRSASRPIVRKSAQLENGND